MTNLVIILITLVLSAFFSGMEIAFISSNRLRIELDKKQGVFAARIISIFTDNPGKFLTTMLVGNNIALVIYGIVMARLQEPLLQQLFTNELAILLCQTFLSTLLILVTAEFLPKIVFRSIANTTLRIFSLPGSLFYYLFYPLTSLIVWLSEIIISGFRKDADEGEIKPVFNKIDLAHLIDNAQEVETDDQESESSDLKLFQNALDFSSVKVRDCMVPRTEIVAIEKNDPISDMHQKIVDTGYSKILIYDDTIDNMIGYITAKNLFKNMQSLEEYMIDISFVPEAMSARRMLEKFIQEKKSVAVVVDEFGGVSGMLTIEDIIEEIFGEIEDEHDTVELIEKEINEQEYIFSGRLEIDYINEKYKLHLPVSEDYETLAGFIFHGHESIPKFNEIITLDQYSFKILKVTKTKIDLVHLKIVTE